MSLVVALPAPELPSQDAAGLRKPLTGWVSKKKGEGSRSRILSSTNKRFYTMDFQSQVVFYSHAEGSKSVSAPIPFRDLLRVEPTAATLAAPEVGAEEADGADMQPADSKGSRGSAGSRPSSGGAGGGLRQMRLGFGSLARRPAEQFGLVLHTTLKTTELFFPSKADADMWLSAFQEAIVLGASDKSSDEATMRLELSTAPGSSTGTSPRSEVQEEELRSASNSPQLPQRVPTPGHKRNSNGSIHAAADDQDALRAREVCTEAGAAEEGEEDDDEAYTGPPACPTTPSVDQERCVRPAFTSSLNAAHALAWGTEDRQDEAAISPVKPPRYEDKAQGLSLQERLAQLEFSDNEEDDDDDPLALARRLSPNKVQERGPKLLAQPQLVAGSPAKPAVATVEQCQAFVPDADSDEE